MCVCVCSSFCLNSSQAHLCVCVCMCVRVYTGVQTKTEIVSARAQIGDGSSPDVALGTCRVRATSGPDLDRTGTKTQWLPRAGEDRPSQGHRTAVNKTKRGTQSIRSRRIPINYSTLDGTSVRHCITGEGQALNPCTDGYAKQAQCKSKKHIYKIKQIIIIIINKKHYINGIYLISWGPRSLHIVD